MFPGSEYLGAIIRSSGGQGDVHMLKGINGEKIEMEIKNGLERVYNVVISCKYLFLHEIEILHRGISRKMFIESLRRPPLSPFFCILSCCDMFNPQWQRMM